METNLMQPETLLNIGLAAGFLQLLGYILYIKIQGIDPNPITWLMFSYGTATLTILEWDKDATSAELFLPTVCSVLALVVFLKCWYIARKKAGDKSWWPEGLKPNGTFERITFGSDLLITIGYIACWFFSAAGILTGDERDLAVLAFLILSNLSVIVEFMPITKSTYEHPEREHALPWTIWACAYATLGVVTWGTHGFWSPLMLYPALNCAAHALIAVLALNTRRGIV